MVRRHLVARLAVDAVGPAVLLQPFEAGLIVGEVAAQVTDRVTPHRALGLIVHSLPTSRGSLRGSYDEFYLPPRDNPPTKGALSGGLSFGWLPAGLQVLMLTNIPQSPRIDLASFGTAYLLCFSLGRFPRGNQRTGPAHWS